MAYPKLLASVDDPEKLSRTLESGGRFLLAVAALFGIDQAPVNEAVQTTLLLPTAAFALIHLWRAGYGSWRKVYTLFEEKIKE